MPVTTGTMRNIWYPKHIAEYLTPDKLQALGATKDVTVERDSTFKTNEERRLDKERQRDAREQVAEAGAEAEREAERASALRALQSDAVVPIELDLLTVSFPALNFKSMIRVLIITKPDRAMTILEELVPQNLDFHAQIISLSPPTPKRVSPSIPINATISVAAAAGTTKETEIDPKRAPIYGSVSTADIASKLKAILAEDEDGERVVLSAEDISFVQELEDKDRVKHLGIFEIDIRLNGATDAIRRTIQVNAKE